MRLLFTYFTFLSFQLISATYVVDITTDVDNGLSYTLNDGTNSLRKCIRLANANAGADIISFNLGGVGGPFTIALSSALPNLTDNAGVTIDGWTNTGNNGTPNTVTADSATTSNPMNAIYKIILSNNSGTIPTGLILASNNNIIQGIVMQDFGDGTISANDRIITISGNSNQVLGCILGLDHTGTTRGTKNYYGVYITGNNNSIGNGTIGGANIISGMNTAGGSLYSAGIFISGAGATGNTIKGNMIGLQADGTTIVAGANQTTGIRIESSAASATIGGVSWNDGNVISGNTTYGVHIINSAVAGNNIFGNIIGPTADGLNNVTSNSQDWGILISNSANNVIGGNTAGHRNVVSANTSTGFYITEAGTTGTIIKGNYIGLNKNGTAYISGANQQGIYLYNTTSNNTIGGTGAGDGNIISGNSTGINISASSTSGNVIYGNIIGTQKDGKTNLASANQTYGVYINNTDNIVVGGNTSSHRNIISGNTDRGIVIAGALSVNNIIRGNYIGVDADGDSIITGGSQDYGIFISSTGNTIGGTAAGEGNIISGNLQNGIRLSVTGAGGNNIQGNIIGLQADGSSFVPSSSQSYGIELVNSPDNIIGGSTSAHRNIISGNDLMGIYMRSASSTNNTVLGNYIGLQSDGSTFVSSSHQDKGIEIASSATSNTIGGTAAGEGNLISGNSNYGIVISTTAGANNIFGNIIGLQSDGATYVTSNAQTYGISINNSPNNIIGGNTAGHRNIISGNETYGIEIYNASATGNQIRGNYIGVQNNGTSLVSSSSQDYGVYITTSAASNTIGGTGAGEGNLISGNTVNGIYTNSSAVAGNNFYGNIIGPQANGTARLTSNTQQFGIELNASPNNTVGGSTSGHRNIISANETGGIRITGAAASGNIIRGNYIGTDNTGAGLITNSNSQQYGIQLQSSATGNTIGGTAAGEGNLLSGNTNYGVYLLSSASANNFYGNYIGPQQNGTAHFASNTQQQGIAINGSLSNTIGGTTSGHRNIISGNEDYGINIRAATSIGNIIYGNYIGPGTGLAALTGSPSQNYGIFIQTSSTNNIVGGIAAGQANIITQNIVGGISVSDVGTTGNKISGNPIYLNAGKPIELNSTGNTNKAKPTIDTWSTTNAIGTAAAGDVIEVFSNQTSNCNDLVAYVGTTTADGSGNWSMAFALTTSDYISATATDGSNNTSEVSICRLLTLPIELLNFDANCKNNSVEITWTTASEKNNDYFTIERTGDGVNKKSEFIVNANGNSSQPIHYSYTDDNPLNGVSYYRLKQTDFDGEFEYFNFVSVDCNETNNSYIQIYPNPNNGTFNLSNLPLNAEISVINCLGQMITKKKADADKMELNISNYPKGMYFVNVITKQNSLSQKVVVK